MPDIENIGLQIKANYASVCNKAQKAAEKAGRDFNDILVLPVSKTQNSEILNAAYSQGIHIFGENYAQEFRDKNKELAEQYKVSPIWHFIGHLQTNKVKYLFPFVSLIHTVDSTEVAVEISKHAEKHGMDIEILMQVNTSGEPQKSGIAPEQAEALLENILKTPRICLKGLMTIGSLSDDEITSAKEFRILYNLKEKLAAQYRECDFRHLSMGMTHDFHIAIQEGATIVRVGTAIFGARNYHK